MIVSDKQVEAALEFKADAASAAKARYDALRTETLAKRAHARALLGINEKCTAQERAARAELDPSYMLARDRADEAEARLIEYKTQLSNADTIIEVWRTESANVRGGV